MTDANEFSARMSPEPNPAVTDDEQKTGRVYAIPGEKIAVYGSDGWEITPDASSHDDLLKFIEPPKQESDNALDALMVYQAFRWEIMKVRFKRDNPAQQAQDLAEKISRYFGLEQCPIRIDGFEVDQDGAIALDVVFLI